MHNLASSNCLLYPNERINPKCDFFLTVFALAKDRGKCLMWKLLMFGSWIVARMRTCSDLLVFTPGFGQYWEN